MRIAIDGLSATDQGADNVAEGEQTPNADTKLTKSMDSDALMDAGFAGAVFTTPAPDEGEDAPDMMDVVYVYTNQEANTDQAWNDVLRPRSLPMARGTVSPIALTDVRKRCNDLNPLNIDENDVSDNSDNSDLFASDHLPNTPGTFMEYEDDGMTMDMDERMFAGTFRGVAGMYGCAESGGDTCRAERDADGKLSLSGGDWTFTPTEPEGADDKVEVAGVIPDPDYLTFGFWLLEDTSDDADPRFTLNALYQVEGTAHNPNTNSTDEGKRGSAKYTGAATGKFTRTETSRDGESATVAGGAFTATATLTAVFGDTRRYREQVPQHGEGRNRKLHVGWRRDRLELEC